MRTPLDARLPFEVRYAQDTGRESPALYLSPLLTWFRFLRLLRGVGSGLIFSRLLKSGLEISQTLFFSTSDHDRILRRHIHLEFQLQLDVQVFVAECPRTVRHGGAVV